ncbi:MAG: DrsE protein [Chloroflexi bacterium]|nr:DrsE protein [Chloroflexota bacterium]
MAEPTRERLALIVKSDTFADLLLALSFAGIATSSGLDTVMFFTNRAARRLKRGGMDDFESVDSVDREFYEGAQQMGFHDLGGMLRDIKSSGLLRVFLCSRGARIWDIDADSMLPEVDSVMGTATFLLEEVRSAQTVLTI